MDDAYATLNPNGCRYGSLKRLSDSEVITLALDKPIAEAVETSQPTVSRVRKQYVEEGLETALHRPHDESASESWMVNRRHSVVPDGRKY